MIRSEGQQTKHNARVLSMARNYKRMEYSVQADLPGDEFSTPDEINSFRPDIIAYRPIGFQKFKTIIVEVETEETVESTHAQQQKEAFKKYEREHPNAEFIIEIAY